MVRLEACGQLTWNERYAYKPPNYKITWTQSTTRKYKET